VKEDAGGGDEAGAAVLPPDHFRGRLVEKAVERRHAGLGREPGDVGGGLDPKDSKP
jgi:hypothetical protein